MNKNYQDQQNTGYKAPLVKIVEIDTASILCDSFQIEKTTEEDLF